MYYSSPPIYMYYPRPSIYLLHQLFITTVFPYINNPSHIHLLPKPSHTFITPVFAYIYYPSLPMYLLLQPFHICLLPHIFVTQSSHTFITQVLEYIYCSALPYIYYSSPKIHLWPQSSHTFFIFYIKCWTKINLEIHTRSIST